MHITYYMCCPTFLIFCICITHIVQCEQTVVWNNYVWKAALFVCSSLCYFCQEHRRWNQVVLKLLRMTHGSVKVNYILLIYRNGGSDIYSVCYWLWSVLERKGADSRWLLLLHHKSVLHLLSVEQYFPQRRSSGCPSAPSIQSLILLSG